MKNELFSIGPITIYGYGLMIAIGVLAAYFSATYRAKKYALDPDKVYYVTVWAVIGGFGGAKLLYLITQLPAILKDPSLLKDARNGFVVYGGIIGGILAAWLFRRWHWHRDLEVSCVFWQDVAMEKRRTVHFIFFSTILLMRRTTCR